MTRITQNMCIYGNTLEICVHKVHITNGCESAVIEYVLAAIHMYLYIYIFLIYTQIFVHMYARYTLQSVTLCKVSHVCFIRYKTTVKRELQTCK